MSQEPKEPNKFAKPFNDMAARIEKNDPNEFGGAFLYVPPVGDPIAVMIADPSKDKESVLAAALGKLNILMGEYAQAKNGPGYGRR